jgi:hypothetical protein
MADKYGVSASFPLQLEYKRREEKEEEEEEEFVLASRLRLVEVAVDDCSS